MIESLPKMLVTGTFTPEDLIVSVSESNRKISPDVESKLEGLWEQMVEKAKLEGRRCYNGISYRLNSLQEKAGKLTLNFSLLEYKIRDGLIQIPEYFGLPEEYWRKGGTTGGSVKTKDGHYVMVELSGKSMNENRIDFVGGIMEATIPMSSGEDIFQSFYAELEEEIGVKKEDIRRCDLKAVFIERRTNVGFYFETLLKVTSAELEGRFKENRDPDIRQIRFYSREEYLRFLAGNNFNKQLVTKLLDI